MRITCSFPRVPIGWIIGQWPGCWRECTIIWGIRKPIPMPMKWSRPYETDTSNSLPRVRWVLRSRPGMSLCRMRCCLLWTIPVSMICGIPMTPVQLQTMRLMVCRDFILPEMISEVSIWLRQVRPVMRYLSNTPTWNPTKEGRFRWSVCPKCSWLRLKAVLTRTRKMPLPCWKSWGWTGESGRKYRLRFQLKNSGKNWL